MPDQKKTTVVHCKRKPYDIYIGRPSLWENPFSHLPNSTARWKVATREESIEKYREWILTQEPLLEALDELDGRVLGCWCSPKPCHGDVLIELLEQRKKR